MDHPLNGTLPAARVAIVNDNFAKTLMTNPTLATVAVPYFSSFALLFAKSMEDLCVNKKKSWKESKNMVNRC